MAKPMPEMVAYFADEILKRTSKSFAKSELNREDFYSIIEHLNAIKNITIRLNRLGKDMNRSEDNGSE